MDGEPFALDAAGNPHPRMLDAALMFRGAARLSSEPIVQAFWLGYLGAMCDATGESSAALNGWLDSHERPLPEVHDALPGEPVDVRRS